MVALHKQEKWALYARRGCSTTNNFVESFHNVYKVHESLVVQELAFFF